MIVDLERADVPAGLDAQVCVVGAGAVGIVLALALAERGVDVLLLEGGGQSLEKRSQALHAGESVGHPFASIEVGRYRVLGGSTTYWGGQVLPFDSHVTQARDWLGHDAWPIDPLVLGRYFQQTYERLGLAEAELADSRVWQKLGIEDHALGPGIDLVMTRWVKIRNFSRLFNRALRAERGPRVVVHANVVALDVPAGSRSVRAARVRSLGGREISVRAQRFVLANGTLEAVRLLLHPLADGSTAPWSQSDWLGRPLIDHLDCTAGEVKVHDHARFHRVFDNIYVGGHKYYPKARLAPQAQQSQGLVDISAQFVYRTRFSEHLEYLKMFLRSVREGGVSVSWRQLPLHAAAVLSTTMPLALRYFRDRRSFKPHDAEVNLVLFCEQLPCTRSRIELAGTSDELGLRRLRVDWQIDGRELKTMKYFGQLLKRELKARGMASIKLDPRLEDEDPAFITAIHDAVHQMGTARMGRTAQEGFVDVNLRVFATDNLFVAGAAVFPSTGFANPTFTAIALALRLCDHLGESLK